ncbi:MAG: hypothetical protein WAK82_28425 [Streptosporangiaceae bacterium]
MPGDDRALQRFLPVRVHRRLADAHEEEGVRAEEDEPIRGRPEPGAGRHDRPDTGLGAHVPGFLGQFPDGRRLQALPAVHPAARCEPDLTARIRRAEQQDPPGRVEHQEAGGGPEPKGRRHDTTVAPCAP